MHVNGMALGSGFLELNGVRVAIMHVNIQHD